MTFEFHVQAPANLLNKSLSTSPEDENARTALDLYSLFQSAPKICRRFKNSPLLRELAAIQPRFNVVLTPSVGDKARIRAVLRNNPGGVEINRSLYALLLLREETALDSQSWLTEFHHFFTWFLGIVCAELKMLRELRYQPLPLFGLLEDDMDRALINLGLMRFFSWDSDFVASYIKITFQTASITDIAASAAATARETEEISEKGGKAWPCVDEEQRGAGNDEQFGVGFGQEPEGECDDDEEEGEQLELDISTEFETSNEQQSPADPQASLHPCILELRLITSNIQHLDTLHQQSTTKSDFRFEVIQYG